MTPAGLNDRGGFTSFEEWGFVRPEAPAVWRGADRYGAGHGAGVIV